MDKPKREEKKSAAPLKKPATGRCVGVWLDRAGATVVMLRDDADPVVEQVVSEAESHYRISGGRKSGMATQDVGDEKSVDRRRLQQLERYYRRVAEAVRGAERVLILGPGEAKLGFERVLREHREPKNRRITVNPADKMTQGQLVAAVKRFFAPGA